MSTPQRGPRHPAELLHRVCDAYLVDEHDVLSQSRLKDVREARQMLYCLLHEQCGWPVTLIGKKLHRDHSTVCHGIKRARERMAAPGGSVLYARVMEREPGRARPTPSPPQSRASGGAVAAR